MSHSEDALDDIVDGVRRGDPDAIAAAYLQVAPALRAFLRGQVNHGEVADDLVEQTFLELVEGHAAIRGNGRELRGWLFRAARHNLYDWRRRAARRSDHELTDEMRATLASEAPSPEEVVGDAHDATLIRAAMDELTPDQREVLELRLIAELPIADVAEITGKSEGAVKQLQHRGLRSLTRILDRDHSGTSREAEGGGPAAPEGSEDHP